MNDGEHLPRGVFERPRHSGIYWIRYADAGGIERREKVGPRIGIAVTLYQKRKTEAFESRKLPDLHSRTVRFSELAADYQEYARVHHARRTQAVDTLRLKLVLATFRERPADAITPQELVRFLGQKDWKPATRNRYRALFSKCYSIAIRNNKVKENPVRKVERFRENNARVRFLDPKEETKLRASIQSFSPRRLPEFELALNTGMRRGEQFDVKWSSVDLVRRVLTVEKSKSGKKRHIPLNDPAVEALRALKSRNGSSLYVVPATESERLGNYPTWFERAVKHAGIPNFHWHDNRHTFASRLVMAGADIRTVQELMGHETLAMTIRYSHLSAPHKREAMAKMQAKYAQKGPTGTKTAPKAKVAGRE